MVMMRAGLVGVGLDLGPQPLDVHVERLGVADVVAAPHPVDQRVARQHPTGVGQQQVQQLELLQRQRHVVAVGWSTRVLVGVEHDVADRRRSRGDSSGAPSSPGVGVAGQRACGPRARASGTAW
mgnify:CR=1 FL=1